MRKSGKRLGILVLSLLLLGALYLGTGYLRSLRLESSRIAVTLTAASGGTGQVRVVQLSDLHRAVFGPDNQELIDLVASKAPDLIFTTGDMIDVRTQDLTACLSLYGRLCQIAPVYYSLGNHEVDRADLGEVLDGLEALGVHLLLDETQTATVGGVLLHIGGIYRANDLPALLEQGPVDLLLCHFPQDLDVYAQAGIPLTFSGHTHGGQFRIPLLDIALYAPGQGWFPEYTTGLYREGGSSLIVSRGLGNSSFPFRVHNPPEIVVADLTFLSDL